MPHAPDQPALPGLEPPPRALSLPAQPPGYPDLPGWLAHRLDVDPELLDFPARIGIRAHPRHCHRCGAVTLLALDSPFAALDAQVDPHPLTPLGEWLALQAGRTTFDLIWIHTTQEMDRRDVRTIAASPPGSHPRRDVVAEHLCGHPPSATTTSVQRTPHQPDPDPHAPPPF